jgi:glycosyltransferase involved in cell wall biosynthesis
VSAAGAGGPRVLLACEWFVRYTAGLARGLADNGCDVTLLCRDHDLEFGDVPGAMQAYVDGRFGGHGRQIALRGRVRDVGELRRMMLARRVVGSWGPEFVHIQDSLTHDLRLAVAGGYPWRRFALTVHDPTNHPGDTAPNARILQVRRALRRQASLIFVHSDSLAAEMYDTGDVRGAVEVIPHPLHGEVAMEPVPTAPTMLFFGRISHYKGLDTLLGALPLVWAELPEARLVVAGHGDLPESPLWDDPRIDLRFEHVPEPGVPSLFAAARCVVMPYRQASQSGVGAQAREYGRASVVTEVGGLPEALAPGSGRLVPPEDPAAMAAALIDVLRTPGLAEEMGEAAAAAGRASTWEVIAARTLDAYRRHLV